MNYKDMTPWTSCMCGLLLHILLLSWLLPPTVHSQNTNATLVQNVACSPYEYYVHTTNGTFHHLPYMVKLHRCHGKTTKHQTLTKCVPSQTNMVDIYVIPFDQVQGQMQGQVIPMLNHTKCYDACVHNSSSCNQYSQWDEQTCKCHCRYSSSPSNCLAPYVWDQSYCDCRCPRTQQNYPCNNKRQVFNKQACGCVCASNVTEECKENGKYLDPQTCACVDQGVKTSASSNPDCLNTKGKVIMAVVIVAEAIAMLAIFYLYNQYAALFKMWCCAEKNQMRFHDDSSSVSEPVDKVDGSTDTTPTMVFPRLQESPKSSRLFRTDSKASDNRPFRFQDSLSRRNRYRYEMGDVVEGDPPMDRTGNTYFTNVHHDASNGSTFNLAESLASVTRV